MGMRRRTFPLLLVVTAVLAAPVLRQAAPAAVVLKSLSVTLPKTSVTFPPGPGVEAADNNCLSCHSVEMVMNQPALPKAAWQAEVAKMRTVYKARIAESDVPAIVHYLTVIKGAK
jgi:cytochrome c5